MTLSEQMKAEGWIEHDGGECPVPLDSRPWVLFRDGEIDQSGVKADLWVDPGEDFWRWDGEDEIDHNNDIIAYRPETGHD